ncbi:MAG: hypothetical protein R3A13_08450 [Bdellovibrionota bacterium]
MRKLLKILMLLFLTTLIACDTVPIAEELDQTQAREVVAELSKFGVSAVAEKSSGGRSSYEVLVRGGQYHQAVQILEERSLPRDRQVSFYELVEPKGLLPNSREMEALRLDHALAVELEEVIRNYPGVNSAQVILRLNFQVKDQAPAASILLKVDKNSSIKYQEISRIIKRTIPGIAVEDVEIVSHVEADYQAGVLEEVGVQSLDKKVVSVPLVPFLFYWQVPEGQYRSLVFVLIGIIGLAVIIGGLFGYWFGIYFRSPQIITSGRKAPPTELLSADYSKRKVGKDGFAKT